MAVSIQIPEGSVTNKVDHVVRRNRAEVPLPPQNRKEINDLIISNEDLKNALNSLPNEIKCKIFNYFLLDLKNRIDHVVRQNPAEVPLPPQNRKEINDLIISNEDLENALNSLPNEISSIIFYYALLDLKINKILDVTEYKKGILIPQAWPATYKAYSFPFERMDPKISWHVHLKQLQDFMQDAQRLGRKTIREIVHGIDLTRKPTASITIEDCMRAGIISRELLFPQATPYSIAYQQQFLKWLCRNRTRILACLRWIPARANTPNVLAEAAKHRDPNFFGRAWAYTTLHKLHGKNPSCKGALWEAINNNDVVLAEYIFSNKLRNTPSTGMLHAAAYNGCLPMVKLLLNKGAQINEENILKKTALQYVIDFFSPYYLSSSIRISKNQEYQKTINQIIVIIFFLRQYKDNGIAININWQLQWGNTLLHMACYVQDPELSLWLADFMIKKDKKLIHIRNADGYTPLQCAAAENHSPMFKFLMVHRADIQVLRLTGTKKDISQYGSEIVNIARSYQRQKATSTKPVIPQKTSRFVSWIQTIRHIYAHLLAAAAAIPHTVYMLCRDAIHALR